MQLCLRPWLSFSFVWVDTHKAVTSEWHREKYDVTGNTGWWERFVDWCWSWLNRPVCWPQCEFLWQINHAANYKLPSECSIPAKQTSSNDSLSDWGTTLNEWSWERELRFYRRICISSPSFLSLTFVLSLSDGSREIFLGPFSFDVDPPPNSSLTPRVMFQLFSFELILMWMLRNTT